jgi:hypothetical protein
MKGDEMNGVEQRTRECEALCSAFREHLLRGRLPPEDAYWWTRIVIEELSAVMTSREGARTLSRENN